jgi:hypothetical protein
MRGLAASLLLALVACAPAHREIIDPDLAACIPASAAAVAGLDVAKLRGSSLYDKLPVRDVAYALAASDGKDWLVLARGQLAGGTSIAPGITAIGSDALVRAAAEQHRTGRTGAPDLLDRASSAPLWLAARGSMTLPVAGNLSNINRLLHQTEYMTLAAQVSDKLDVQAAGYCRSADTAKHLEENLRALASLLLAKYPVTVRSEGTTVRVEASLPVRVISEARP